MSYQNPRQEKIHTGCSCSQCSGRHCTRLNKEDYYTEYYKGCQYWGHKTREEAYEVHAKELRNKDNGVYRNTTRRDTRRALHKSIRREYRSRLRKVEKGIANECEIVILGLGYTD